MYSSKVRRALSRKRIGIGDTIEVVDRYSSVFKGILLDRSALYGENTIVIKLNNGYNIGLDYNNIRSIKLVAKAKKERKKRPKRTSAPKGEFFSILHTGGTIASKVDYKTGGVVSRFDPEELLAMFPSLSKYGKIHSVFLGNMFSDDMRFSHYKIIAKAIEKEIKLGTKGVIIAHGTDTMAYTSAALSFIFDNLPIPVILVGAQRSSDRASSDAEMNLVCAAKFIMKTDFRGVAICMHETSSDDTCIIIDGVNARKLHTSRRDAFKPVNDSIIARVEYQDDDITFISEYKKKGDKIGKLVVKPEMENKVAIVKIHTNFFAEHIAFFREKGYKGLVIEGTGLGHAPISKIDKYTSEHLRIKNEIKKLVDSGCVVVMCSQTIFGRVNMNVYSPGRELLHIGVVPGEDMLPETAFVKLAWLLRNEKKRVRELMTTNLRGEIKRRLVE